MRSLTDDYAAAQHSIDFCSRSSHLPAIEAHSSVNRQNTAPAAFRSFPELPFSRGSFRTRLDACVLRPRRRIYCELKTTHDIRNTRAFAARSPGARAQGLRHADADPAAVDS